MKANTTLTIKTHAVPFRMPSNLEGVQLFATDVSEYSLAALEKLHEVLSPEEQAKVKRYRMKKDRLLSVVARGNLRRILANQLGIKPKQVQLGTNEHGKPILLGKEPTFDFNISHAGTKVAIATLDHSNPANTHVCIGIDLEVINQMIDIQVIAKHYFSSNECRLINQSPEPAITFFTFWTRKEALLKAAGVGLVDELSLIDVSRTRIMPTIAGKRAELVSGQFNLWTFNDIQDYLLSLAIHPSIY